MTKTKDKTIWKTMRPSWAAAAWAKAGSTSWQEMGQNTNYKDKENYH